MRQVLILFLAVTMVFASFALVSGAQSIGISSYQAAPSSFSSYYSSQDIANYWPSLADPDTCKARQDIILQVAPGGCQPMVVRSDLLAEQNVPVFCQIMGVVVNPLIDVKNIRNIRFDGAAQSKDVANVGFHPARAALNTRDILTGSPLINNVGYVVVILKKNPKEKELPEFVSVNLTAKVDYTSGNALGIGKAEFFLKEVGDADWEQERIKQSFWGGRYSVRLESANDNEARISLYEGKFKVTTVTVNKNKPMANLYMPGSYCQVSLQVYYDGYQGVGNRAELEIADGNSVDKIVVYDGSRFLNDKCYVKRLIPSNSSGVSGSVEIGCPKETFTLSLTPRAFDYQMGDKVIVKKIGELANVEGEIAAVSTTVAVGGERTYGIRYTPNGEEQPKIQPDVKYSDISPLTGGKEFISNAELKDASDQKNLGDAIAAYNRVVDEYPSERGEGMTESYGEQALSYAIVLAHSFGQLKTEYELTSLFVQKYPASSKVEAYNKKLGDLSTMDSSKASKIVSVDNSNPVITLRAVGKPKIESTADFVVGSNLMGEVKEGETKIFTGGKLILERVEDNRVRIGRACAKSGQNTGSVYLNVGESTTVCDSAVSLQRTNVEKYARIRLIPEAKGTELRTNISVTIGIEKRAIKLSNERKKDMINNLNESIEKWQRISDKLLKAVEGLKGTCLATSAVLTVKNLYEGFSGASIARQKVMNGENGWKEVCKREIAEQGHANYGKTISQCLMEHSGDISKDVNAWEAQMKSTNEVIDGIESAAGVKSGGGGILGLFKEESVNQDEAKKALRAEILAKHKRETIKVGNEEKKVDDLLANLSDTTYGEMRDLYTNLEMRKSGGLSDGQVKNLDSGLSSTANRISSNIAARAEDAKNAAENKQTGVPEYLRTGTVAVVYGGITTGDKLKVEGILEEDKTASNSFVAFQGIDGGQYLLKVKKSDGATDAYSPEVNGLYKKGADGKYAKVDTTEKAPEAGNAVVKSAGQIITENKIGIIKPSSTRSYRNKMQESDWRVRYYETAPYDGLPALVPFDVVNGWYAGTRPTLSSFGGTSAYQSSGRVTSLWICNVGTNGKIDFDTGLGDDICEMVNLNTGQSLANFPGLSADESKQKIQAGINAIQEAEKNYKSGVGSVKINGVDLKVGNPMANTPETQCEDFMSPGDCTLLFNVCDPVICPNTRCNLGGEFNVPDVIQSGIIGSAVLCLNNFGMPNKGGVLIPVCLSGMQAGLDSYISVLKGHRDCLQESLNKGTMSGICDYMYSVYKCNLFWNQIGPFVNALIPKLVAKLYGQGGARGGGEYSTVAAAWANADKSIKYFTQTYAANSLKNFQVNSLGEIGSAVCNGYVSAKGPKGFKSVMEAESPPQFTARFESSRHSDATVPATAQYKVYYHIYAGRNAGVYYSVYLKTPPESSYYSYNPTVSVANGYIQQGEYADAAKDFTAPEGYKQLCVMVDGNERCGFKEVSTGFATTYLADQYAKEKIATSDIKTESGCISGSPSVYALAVNTNPLSAAQEAVLPDDSQRGIVRVCATSNPGQGTDATRYVDVGYCTDEKMRCYLDKNSVNNAISQYNAGARNATLQELKSMQSAQSGGLEDSKVTSEQVKSAIGEYDKKIVALKTGGSTTDAISLIGQIELMLENTILNDQKANLLLLRGMAYDKIAILNKKYKGGAVSGAAKTPPEAGLPAAAPAAEVIPNAASLLYLETNYDPRGTVKILVLSATGEDTKIYVMGTRVYLKIDSMHASSLAEDYPEIARISDNKITFIQGKMDLINKIYYDQLNGATLTFGITVISSVSLAAPTTALAEVGECNRIGGVCTIADCGDMTKGQQDCTKRQNCCPSIGLVNDCERAGGVCAASESCYITLGEASELGCSEVCCTSPKSAGVPAPVVPTEAKTGYFLDTAYESSKMPRIMMYINGVPASTSFVVRGSSLLKETNGQYKVTTDITPRYVYVGMISALVRDKRAISINLYSYGRTNGVTAEQYNSLNNAILTSGSTKIEKATTPSTCGNGVIDAGEICDIKNGQTIVLTVNVPFQIENNIVSVGTEKVNLIDMCTKFGGYDCNDYIHTYETALGQCVACASFSPRISCHDYDPSPTDDGVAGWYATAISYNGQSYELNKDYQDYLGSHPAPAGGGLGVNTCAKNINPEVFWVYGLDNNDPTNPGS